MGELEESACFFFYLLCNKLSCNHCAALCLGMTSNKLSVRMNGHHQTVARRQLVHPVAEQAALRDVAHFNDCCTVCAIWILPTNTNFLELHSKSLAATRKQPLVYHLPCHTSSDGSLAQLSPYFGDTTRNTVQGLERLPQSDADDVLATFLRNMLLIYNQPTSSTPHTDEDNFVFHNFVAAFHCSVEGRKYFPGLYDSQCADFVKTVWHKKKCYHKKKIRSFFRKKMFYSTRNYKHSKITKRRLYLRSGHSFIIKPETRLIMSRYKFQSEILAQRQKFISLPSLKKRIKLISSKDLTQTNIFFSKSDNTLMNNSCHRLKEISASVKKVDIVNDNTYGVNSLETTEDGTDGPTSDEFITGTNHSTRSISYVSATTSTEINEEDGVCNVSSETVENMYSGVKDSGNVSEFKHREKSSKKATLMKLKCEKLSQVFKSDVHEVHSDNEKTENVRVLRHGEKSSKKASLKKRYCEAFSQTASSEFREVHSGKKEIGNAPVCKYRDKSSKKGPLKKRNYLAFSKAVRSQLCEVQAGNEETMSSRELEFENNIVFHSQSTSTTTQIWLPPLAKSQETYFKNLDNDEAGYEADCDTADSESENSNSDLEEWLDLLLFSSKTDESSKSKSTQYTSASEHLTEDDSKHCSSYYSITNDKSSSELCLVNNTISKCTSEHKMQRCHSGSILNTISHRKVFTETDINKRPQSEDDHKVFRSVETIDSGRWYTKPCVPINTSSEYMTGGESKTNTSRGSVVGAVCLPELSISTCTSSEYHYEADSSEASGSSYKKMFPPINLSPSCYWQGNDQQKGRQFTVLHENKKCLLDSLSELQLPETIAAKREKSKELLEKQATLVPTKQTSSTSLAGPLCRTCVFKCGLLPQNGKTVRGQEILQHLLETDKKSKKQENKPSLSQTDKKPKFCSKCRILFTKNA